MMRRRHAVGAWRKAVLLFLAVPALALGGLACSRSDDAGAKATPDPAQTVNALIAAKQARRYDDMPPLILPPHGPEVVRTLLAVEQFLTANQELCELVRQRVGLGLAQTIDQGNHALYLDIFSRYVEVLSVVPQGDTATVTFTVNRRLPARRTQLRLVDGRWLYDPGPGDYRALAAAYTQMAEGLRLVQGDLRSGRLSPAELRDDPEKLVEEVRIRLLAGVKMLPGRP